jgi:hypothetical protein
LGSGLPFFDCYIDFKEKFKATMAKRYYAANKALDLTKFHGDFDKSNRASRFFSRPIHLISFDGLTNELNESKLDKVGDLRDPHLNDNQEKAVIIFCCAPQLIAIERASINARPSPGWNFPGENS